MAISGVAVIGSGTSSVIGILLAPRIYVSHTYDPKRKYRPRLISQIHQRRMKIFITLN